MRTAAMVGAMACARRLGRAIRPMMIGYFAGPYTDLFINLTALNSGSLPLK
jgi:hypothetical protein